MLKRDELPGWDPELNILFVLHPATTTPQKTALISFISTCILSPDAEFV